MAVKGKAASAQPRGAFRQHRLGDHMRESLTTRFRWIRYPEWHLETSRILTQSSPYAHCGLNQIRDPEDPARFVSATDSVSIATCFLQSKKPPLSCHHKIEVP